MSDTENTARTRGMSKMREVYGFSVDPKDVEGDYTAFTVDHLFGTIWSRTALDIPDRRLLTIGVLAALGRSELLAIQFESALRLGEMDVDQVREVVIHLTHYVGWPLSTGMQAVCEQAIAQHRASTGTDNSGEDE